jgi:hypothetical protein
MAQYVRNVFDFHTNGGIQNENDFEQNRESSVRLSLSTLIRLKPRRLVQLIRLLNFMNLTGEGKKRLNPKAD